MEWYQIRDVGEFIVGLASSVAWPLALVVIVVSFREPIQKLLNKIFLIKYGDAEVHIEKELDQAKESLDQARNTGELQLVWDTDPPINLNPRDPKENLMRVADFSPPSAIVGAWVEIETALQELARRKNVDGAEKLYASRLVRELDRREVLKPHLIKTLKLLVRIRNESAHGGQVAETSIEDAKHYLDIAFDLLRSLRNQ